MGMWQTTLEANFKPIAQVTIKRGIYQGEALSPLLFCPGLNHLSEITDWLQILTTEWINRQQPPLDYSKLYARSE